MSDKSESGDELQWVRPPLQTRSQKTLHALLDATSKLLADRPFTSISVQDITKEANSSVGAFYARFPDKMAVLHALHERYVDEGRATTQAVLDPARWEAVPFPVFLAQLCAFLVDSMEEAVGIRRGTLLASVEKPIFAERTRALREATIADLAAFLATRTDEMAHDNPEHAAAFMHRLLFGTLDQRALFGPFEGETREQLARDLCRAVMGYLGVDESDPAA
jgi:AcrR family transcriptional regulator